MDDEPFLLILLVLMDLVDFIDNLQNSLIAYYLLGSQLEGRSRFRGVEVGTIATEHHEVVDQQRFRVILNF
jgi:hypothetical protein